MRTSEWVQYCPHCSDHKVGDSIEDNEPCGCWSPSVINVSIIDGRISGINVGPIVEPRNMRSGEIIPIRLQEAQENQGEPQPSRLPFSNEAPQTREDLNDVDALIREIEKALDAI